jgi:hypothetical protein
LARVLPRKPLGPLADAGQWGEYGIPGNNRPDHKWESQQLARVLPRKSLRPLADAGQWWEHGNHPAHFARRLAGLHRPAPQLLGRGRRRPLGRMERPRAALRRFLLWGRFAPAA